MSEFVINDAYQKVKKFTGLTGQIFIETLGVAHSNFVEVQGEEVIWKHFSKHSARRILDDRNNVTMLSMVDNPKNFELYKEYMLVFRCLILSLEDVDQSRRTEILDELNYDLNKVQNFLDKERLQRMIHFPKKEGRLQGVAELLEDFILGTDCSTYDDTLIIEEFDRLMFLGKMENFYLFDQEFNEEFAAIIFESISEKKFYCAVISSEIDLTIESFDDVEGAVEHFLAHLHDYIAIFYSRLRADSTEMDSVETINQKLSNLIN